MTPEQLNALAAEIYANNLALGWWDDRDPLIALQLISTEIAEATEGERKNLMDDHLPHRRMGEVELADALIRTLDFGGRYDLVYRKNTDKNAEDFLRKAKSTPVRHFHINEALCRFGDWFYGLSIRDAVMWSYSQLIDSILLTAELAGYDIEGAMAEKRAYNKTRADHTREARSAEHGKKF